MKNIQNVPKEERYYVITYLELKNANVIVHICVFRACCRGQLAANDKIANGAMCDNGELQQQER